MRHYLFVAALFAISAFAADNQLTEQEKADGWASLFDGTSTAGWLEIGGKPFPTAAWTVENGCLKAITSPHGVQDIQTIGRYSSFELTFEWRIAAGGNSGVKYLIQRTDEWLTKGTNARQARARGFEYQLSDDVRSDETRRDPTRGTGSLYSFLGPTTKALRPAGEFNLSRICVDGQRVEHWLNGSRVLVFALTDPAPASLLKSLRKSADIVWETPISLQNHNSEVWFRNIKIRRLP